jgi:hypothetical protein
MLIDGSFVMAKLEPNDMDAVVLMPYDFQDQVAADSNAAIELERMLLTRYPEEVLAAEDETDWSDWVEFFCRTREADGRRKRSCRGRVVIASLIEYEKAQEELQLLENRLEQLQQTNPVGSKGFTKAGIRRMIARIQEELALFEGSEEARQST